MVSGASTQRKKSSLFGIKAYPIAVEVDLSSGQKLSLMTVGLPDTAVRESSERVKAALRNCGYILPPQRITINLAPADVKKEGSAFDLSNAHLTRNEREAPAARFALEWPPIARALPDREIDELNFS